MPNFRSGAPLGVRPPQDKATAMSKTANLNRSRHATARLRSIRQRVRRSFTLGLVTAGLALGSTAGQAQMGQTAMAPAGGVVNQAVAGLRELNLNGPGYLYYGVNAADRGLGYLGSYMTLGGFIPLGEDDLGGFWSADLRSHLSVYGGFFSNVGAVRKQFIGGTLLGVGVYWDYDGDLNQYSDTTIASGGQNYVFSGGQVYNQVGVSGEWLTDYGNLRSNGYIPVGSTGQLMGPFVGNSILCVNGINAALGGADLEVGAYIPGLADWAGMISVGGYALGNTRYEFAGNQAAVPWFGGVYTRLDMTLIQNWDFSLQYNNDSFFDSTGFARLTYRMGGSRRRNVPDQMEQPMMRNEHIVRAHQAPEVALNPQTGLPWNVYHVDNSATTAGTGTADSPFITLGQAEASATAAYDIVYVSVGNSATQPYVTPFNGYSFSAPNQLLIGEGSTSLLPTLNCGDKALFAGSDSDLYPVLTNPAGPAITIDQPGSRVEHFRITGSPVAITDGGGLAAPGVASVSDVFIVATPGLVQRGIEISNSTGRFDFDNIQLTGLNNDGFVMNAAGGNATITNSTFTGVGNSAIRVTGANASVAVTNTAIAETVGTAVLVDGVSARVAITNSTISDTVGDALVASGLNSRIIGSDVTITDPLGSGIIASGQGALVQGTGFTISDTGSDAIQVSGDNANVSLASSTISRVSGFGALLTGSNAGLYLTDETTITNAESNSLHILGDAATVLVQDSSILNSNRNAIYVNGGFRAADSGTSQVTVLRSEISAANGVGVWADGVNAVDPLNPNNGGVVQIFSSEISNTLSGGVLANGSNFDIGRDPNTPGSPGTRITNTGGFGIAMNSVSRVRVTNSTISGVTDGINVTGTVAGPEFSNLIAIGNTISAADIGIDITANHGPPPDNDPTSFTNANISSNRITSGGTADILLTTTEPPADDAPILFQPIGIQNAGNAFQLGAFNIGATVVQDPANRPGLVAYQDRFFPAPAPVVALPPPTPPVPLPPPRSAPRPMP